MKIVIDEGSGTIFDDDRPWLGGNIRGGDARCEDPAVWNYLISRFQPLSIIDVGCGEGQLMKYFYDHNIIVCGVDGLEVNRENADSSIADKIIVHDYRDGALIIPADMVLACEFVEHIDVRYMVNFLPQFCACKTLIFTHAVPDQAGHHHVNCQTDEYWVTLMTTLGLVFKEEETTYARSLVKDSFWRTLLIFEQPIIYYNLKI